jgi:hypothetical protein
MSYRQTIAEVLNFHFKHHRHGIAMPHETHVPHGYNYRGMYIGAGVIGDPNRKLSQTDLYHQADLNFWATTQYKIGLPLNPQDPLDKPYIKQWQAIYQKILNQYKKGTLVLIPADWNEVVAKHQPQATPPSPVSQPNLSQAPTPVPSQPQAVTSPTSLADVHQDQADIHQAQADDHKAQATESAQKAVQAAAAGDDAAAQAHTDDSNAHNEKAEEHQKQADTHANIAASLKGAKGEAQKIANDNPSNLVGVIIYTDGTSQAFPFSGRDVLDDWYGKAGDDYIKEVQDTGVWTVQYVGAFDKTDPQWPDSVNEFGPAVNTIVVKGHIPPVLTVTPTPPEPVAEVQEPPKKSGGGAAIGAILALGGGLLLATASAKGKR